MEECKVTLKREDYALGEAYEVFYDGKLTSYEVVWDNRWCKYAIYRSHRPLLCKPNLWAVKRFIETDIILREGERWTRKGI